MLVFLIIDFNIHGHVKKKFFQENTILKGIIFFLKTFKLRHAIIRH